MRCKRNTIPANKVYFQRTHRFNFKVRFVSHSYAHVHFELGVLLYMAFKTICIMWYIFAFSSHPFLTQPVRKHYFIETWTGRKERARDGGQWFGSRLVPGPLLWSFLEALPQTNGEDVKLLVTMAMCEPAAPFTFISILVFFNCSSNTSYFTLQLDALSQIDN